MKLSIITLKILRRAYKYFIKENKSTQTIHIINDANKASDIIYNTLANDKPCMIARFGSTELTTIINYLGIKYPKHSIIKFIKDEQPEWWWNKHILNQMQQWSGFFPITENKISEFCELMLHDTIEVDILGSWMKDESYLNPLLKHAKLIHLRLLEPFWSEQPWTRILEGKKILVVHPFASLIYKQYYNKRTLLFKNPQILPSFQLKTLKAIQSLGGVDNGFKDWFEALNYMKNEIDKIDYDICLIGCGAYGFPLAAHVKRMGKKAIHLGGALQLLFGIKGNRWENPTYGVKEWGIPKSFYSNLMNEHWVKPDQEDRPINANDVEGACYW